MCGGTPRVKDPESYMYAILLVIVIVKIILKTYGNYIFLFVLYGGFHYIFHPPYYYIICSLDSNKYILVLPRIHLLYYLEMYTPSNQSYVPVLVYRL